MKKNIYFILLVCFFLSGCGGQNIGSQNNGNEIEGSGGEAIVENVGGNNNQVDTNEINNQYTGEISQTESGASAEVPTQKQADKQAWFGVDECNRIIAFDLCVIEKAPIENQEPMKQNLQKSIEPWKQLANPQLREICNRIIQQDIFKEVVDHYEKLDDGCSF